MYSFFCFLRVFWGNSLMHNINMHFLTMKKYIVVLFMCLFVTKNQFAIWSFLWKDSNTPNVAIFYSRGNFVGFDCINESINAGRSYYNGNISIFSCSFQRNTLLSGYGGVIYVFSGSLSMNVSNSEFFMCSCSERGGAIHFASLNCYLRKICAFNCTANEYYHFACLDATSNNFVEYLSVAQCSHQSVKGYTSFLVYHGKQIVHNSNSSLNIALGRAGIYVDKSNNFSCSYCTISNNIVVINICLRILDIQGNISFANILYNNSPQDSVVTVDSVRFYINYCIFIGNKNNLITNGKFGVIYHSFISHNGISSTINNNTIATIATYMIPHYRKHFCQADVPINDDLSPRTYNEECHFFIISKRRNINGDIFIYPILVSLQIYSCNF